MQFQRILDEEVARGAAPFLIAAVAGSEGVRWTGHAGDVRQDAQLCIFSMSKAIGSLAAVILAERGKLDLDIAVGDILPAFDDLRILTGFDGDAPILRRPERRATLRHLITHQSGLSYEHWNPNIARWLKTTGAPNMRSGAKAGLMYPLTFEPGTDWAYGVGIDWLGQVVEAISGKTIDRFCHDEIFAPLGMSQTSFEPGPVTAQMFDRRDHSFTQSALAPPQRPEFFGIGQCLYATASDYIRFLRMLLRGGELDGVRVLERDCVALMFTPQTGPLPHPLLRSANPRGSADFDPFPQTECSHTAGFLRVNQDVAGMRRAGSLGWAGFANTHFWLDPASDIAAVFMTQLVPFADPPMMAAYRKFEQAVYAT